MQTIGGSVAYVLFNEITDWLLDKLAEPGTFLAIAGICVVGAVLGELQKD